MKIRWLLSLCMAAPNLLPAVEPVGTASLRRDTPVLLRLDQTVSSATARSGDRVEFQVSEDVRAGGRVVIARGSLAWAHVNAATPKSRLARDGRLDIQLDSVCLADGSRAPLQAVNTSAAAAQSHGGGSEDALFLIPALPVMLFVTGRDVQLDQGQEVTAWTARDAVINLARAANGPVSKCEPTPAGNADAALMANAPTVAAVAVRSDPVGAEIHVDGRFAGQTPSTLRLSPGDHTISLKLPGRAPWQRTLAVTPGSETNITAKLDPTVESRSEPWLWPLPPVPAKTNAQEATK